METGQETNIMTWPSGAFSGSPGMISTAGIFLLQRVFIN